MTKERARELTEIVVKTARNNKISESEKIGKYHDVAFEYLTEISEAMPPVTIGTLPFVIAALGAIKRDYVEEADEEMKLLADSIQRCLEDKMAIAKAKVVQK